MIIRTRWLSLLLPLFVVALLVPATVGGCQDDGGDDDGTGGTTPTAGTGNTGNTGNTGGGTGNTGGGTGASGGVVGCGYSAVDATIAQVTNEAHADHIGPGVEVRLTGVVAMSRLFLVSKSSNSGSCLWGVFVSAPGISVTEPYSGILLLDYGTGVNGDGYCTVPPIEPSGSRLPDDVQPGDVIDAIGYTDTFLLDQYCTEPEDSQVPARQITGVCSAEITGTAAVPAPASMSTADLADIASPTNQAFHDQWGGVKVRFTDVSAAGTADSCEDGSGDNTIVGDYGIITLDQDGAEVGDKIYYQGLLRSQGDDCRGGPVICTPPDPVLIGQLDAFHYMDFCTWGLQVGDKCAEILDDQGVPLSQDCNDDASYCVQ